MFNILFSGLIIVLSGYIGNWLKAIAPEEMKPGHTYFLQGQNYAVSFIATLAIIFSIEKIFQMCYSCSLSSVLALGIVLFVVLYLLILVLPHKRYIGLGISALILPYLDGQQHIVMAASTILLIFIMCALKHNTSVFDLRIKKELLFFSVLFLLAFFCRLIL